MNMQSGFGDAGDRMAEQYIETMTNILLPVFEKGTLLAAEYCKACGRETLLSEDMEYAMKYCAMNAVGETVGTMFPDLYEDVCEDSDESDNDEEMEVVDVSECPKFERYTGSDHKFILVNEAYDRWGSWVPQNPTEQMLKNAINSNEPMGA
jgi:histone H3/H4